MEIEKARDVIACYLSREFKQQNILDSPNKVKEYLRVSCLGLEHEVFLVLFLDVQNRLIDTTQMFRGTLTQTSVYPREVVKEVLKRNAASVIFAHNHPSGCVTPSSADRLLTRKLAEALALIDVKMLDHFIIGDTDIASFAENGDL